MTNGYRTALGPIPDDWGENDAGTPNRKTKESTSPEFQKWFDDFVKEAKADNEREHASKEREGPESEEH